MGLNQIKNLIYPPPYKKSMFDFLYVTLCCYNEVFILRYMFPNHIVMRFFEQPQIRLPSGACVDDKPNYPETEEELEDNWNEIRETFKTLFITKSF